MKLPFADSEAALESEAIGVLADLGWETWDCQHDHPGPESVLGRETNSEVVLRKYLVPAIRKLNPNLPNAAISAAVDELIRDRTAMSLAAANREVHRFLRDGVPVMVRDEDEIGEDTPYTVRLIDWNEPANNHYLLGGQVWITSECYEKRPDLIGFVNGIPLLLVELKASHVALQNAYRYNITDYKDTIPALFSYNAFIVLSNGAQSRVGSLTAGFEHYAEWKKINDEGEEGIVSLDTILRGTCDPARLLDLVENFTLFAESKGGFTKLVAKNHQYLGVNRALAAVNGIHAKTGEDRGKLGVFWHTQGSGKSYSAVMFCQKVLRKVPGNWTFLIVTDRKDLDEQLFGNFATTGAVLESPERVRSQSAEHLKRLLKEDHRYIFTLIQKFQSPDDGKPYPKLSDRSDIIVLTDEAHRSQYDSFALNMRRALPHASFIGFTGTPLMVGDELTKRVFGDYVSVYNFSDSIRDGNTVPLYYENRIPELQIVNDEMNDQIAGVLDSADLTEEQEAKLESLFKKEYHLITRDDRLERVAADIVDHYMGRGVLAKAMVVCIDKITTLRLFDKVQKHWKTGLAAQRRKLADADPADRPELESRIRYLEAVDMAVVVSSSQNEIDDCRKHRARLGLDADHHAIKGSNKSARGLLDIEFHRRRMVAEDLESKFKESDDPLRIVFVCAMWITGFDVPSCSTLYLDKPMKNHTLMQTIARANRVWGEKASGLVVDYIGVFRNLQRALAIYATPTGTGGTTGELPVEKKQALVEELRKALAAADEFVSGLGITMPAILGTQGLARERLKDEAFAAILRTDETRRQFMSYANTVNRLFKALTPDSAANAFVDRRRVYHVLAERIKAEMPEPDISAIMREVEKVLDRSIASEGYVITGSSNERNGAYLDLSLIDFDALARQFQQGRKTVEAQRLRGALTRKVAEMVKRNRTRMDYLREFQEMIAEYNSESANVEEFYAKLIQFAKKLTDEERRTMSESLTEEELAIFDLLSKPEMNLTEKEKRDVKRVARDLLAKLKSQRLVLDWRRKPQSRAAVRTTIMDVLDELPRRYTKEIYEEKCKVIYDHVYAAYMGQGRSLYMAN